MNACEVMKYLESQGIAVSGVLVPPPAVRPETLVPICHDYLNGRVSGDDLEEIGRVLLRRPDRAANQDDCDSEFDYDGRVELLLYDWHAPDTWYNPEKGDPAHCIRKFLAETTGETKR